MSIRRLAEDWGHPPFSRVNNVAFGTYIPPLELDLRQYEPNRGGPAGVAKPNP